MLHLPGLSGTYALHLVLENAHSLDIGSLGSYYFPAGHYIYLGSARGPGGLRARLTRHITGTGKRHWHIDYLRALARITDAHYIIHTQQEGSPLTPPLECRWGQALVTLPHAYTPVRRFGAGDCKAGCPAHLVAFNEGADINIEENLSQALEGQGLQFSLFRLRQIPQSNHDRTE